MPAEVPAAPGRGQTKANEELLAGAPAGRFPPTIGDTTSPRAIDEHRHVFTPGNASATAGRGTVVG
jgi:hypothetical protein